MKVLAYCIKPATGLFELEKIEELLPAVPAGLVSAEGFSWKDGTRLVDGEFKLQDLVPIDLPENCWLGIETDGSCTVLHPDEEPKWRASRATRAIEDSQLLSQSSPIRAVCALHAAAALVGLQVAKIHGALAKVRKSPSEPLEVTVQALVETLEKERVQQR